MQENTVFSVLNALNCNEHVEKKGSLSYLSVLQKGDKVHVIGRIRCRRYTDVSGIEKTQTDIVANTLEKIES